MRLQVGYELVYDCPQPTPMMLMLNIHHTRAGDIVVPDRLSTDPEIPLATYRDGFGNWCSRIVAPQGRLRIYTNAVVNDTGKPDPIAWSDEEHAVQDLPEECLVFLLGSRYCETDRLSDIAWSLFGATPTGAGRVKAICDYVHRHIVFNYHNARSTRTAWDALNEGTGVCRDYAHLAIAFCRCMNIPARYCTGYLSDVGMPPPHGTMDFAAWFEAYVGGRWHTFDPRNSIPCYGRVLMARGRDASDVAISNTFGPNVLSHFTVRAEPVPGQPLPVLVPTGGVPSAATAQSS
jgi:transglutaminase-like putative cysteine protease